MCLVDLHDLPPVWIQIGLGRDNRCYGADFECLSDERQLGLGELLAGVADHQHRVRVGQHSERGRKMRLTMAADARGVDEDQAALEQGAVRRHRDSEHLPTACCGMASQIVLDIGDRDLDRLGLAFVGARDDQLRGGLFAIGHHAGDHGGLVVADPRDRHVQQRIEQLTLALLELAGDDDADLRVADPGLGLGHPLDQVAAVGSLGDFARMVDQFNDDLDLAWVVRLRHGVPFIGRRWFNGRRASWRGDLSLVPASCGIGLSVGQNRPASTSTWVSICWCTELSVCTELSLWLSCTELSVLWLFDDLSSWLASIPPEMSPPWVSTVVTSPPWVSVVVVWVGAMTTPPPAPPVALPPSPPPPVRIPPPWPPSPPAAPPPLVSMSPVLTIGPSLPAMTSPAPLLVTLPWLSLSLPTPPACTVEPSPARMSPVLAPTLPSPTTFPSPWTFVLSMSPAWPVLITLPSEAVFLSPKVMSPKSRLTPPCWTSWPASGLRMWGS